MEADLHAIVSRYLVSRPPRHSRFCHRSGRSSPSQTRTSNHSSTRRFVV